MGTVEITIYYWLSEAFTGGSGTSHTFQEPFQEGETLGDLLNRLTSKLPSFGIVIFDSKNQRLYPQVNFVFRDKAGDPQKDLGRKLNDGDKIVFLPIYAGG
jgi:molybdopterin converting factor small subunit